MGLAIETTKTKEFVREYESGYLCQGTSTRSSSTWHCTINWIALGYSSLKSYRGTDDILCIPPDNH